MNYKLFYDEGLKDESMTFNLYKHGEESSGIVGYLSGKNPGIKFANKWSGASDTAMLGLTGNLLNQVGNEAINALKEFAPRVQQVSKMLSDAAKTKLDAIDAEKGQKQAGRLQEMVRMFDGPDSMSSVPVLEFTIINDGGKATKTILSTMKKLIQWGCPKFDVQQYNYNTDNAASLLQDVSLYTAPMKYSPIKTLQDTLGGQFQEWLSKLHNTVYGKMMDGNNLSIANTLSLRYGKLMKYTSLLVKSVSIQFSNLILANNWPAEVTFSLELTSAVVPTAELVQSWFALDELKDES